MKLKDLKKGEYFKLKDTPNATVYVRGDYVKAAKKYSVHKFMDICSERFLSGEKEAITDFEF